MAVLERLLPLLGRVVTREWRRAAKGKPSGQASHRHASPEELLADVLVHINDVTLAGGGMNEPKPLNTSDATPWLGTWFRSRCRDVLRKAYTTDNLEELIDESSHSGLKLVSDHSVDPKAEAHLDIQRYLQDIRNAIEDGTVFAHHALVMICLYVPDRLEEADVLRALGPTGVGHPNNRGATFSRSASVLWSRLQVWSQRRDTQTDGDTRLELAWIFFSTDTSDQSDWRHREPRLARDARDLLRIWDRRARSQLRLILNS
jgi:hypothetical protein